MRIGEPAVQMAAWRSCVCVCLYGSQITASGSESEEGVRPLGLMLASTCVCVYVLSVGEIELENAQTDMQSLPPAGAN